VFGVWCIAKFESFFIGRFLSFIYINDTNLYTVLFLFVFVADRFKSRVRHFLAKLAQVCTTITRHAIELQSCSNPLKMRKLVLLLRFKNLGSFGFEFCVDDVIIGVGLGFIG